MARGVQAEPRWARDFWRALEPFASGAYVNDLGRDDEDRIRIADTDSIQVRLEPFGGLPSDSRF
jgi:hypothetical protein